MGLWCICPTSFSVPIKEKAGAITKAVGGTVRTKVWTLSINIMDPEPRSINRQRGDLETPVIPSIPSPVNSNPETSGSCRWGSQSQPILAGLQNKKCKICSTPIIGGISMIDGIIPNRKKSLRSLFVLSMIGGMIRRFI